jgi:hypothetical protein
MPAATPPVANAKFAPVNAFERAFLLASLPFIEYGLNEGPSYERDWPRRRANPRAFGPLPTFLPIIIMSIKFIFHFIFYPFLCRQSRNHQFCHHFLLNFIIFKIYF